MKTREIPAGWGKPVMARVPEASDVASLNVGDMAPDCFGKLAKVARISYRGTDITGRPFVGYATEFGEHGTMTQSMKVGELMLTVGLTSVLNSEQCRALERDMNGGIPQCHCTSIVFRGEHAVTCPCYK